MPTTPSGTLTYTDAIPVAANVQTQGTSPNAPGPRDLPNADVSLTRYIDAAVGGQAGPVGTLGYSTGINPGNMPQPLTGLAVLFPRVDLSGETGPVGRENWSGNLAAGVAQQNTQPPDLTTIYASLVSHGI